MPISWRRENDGFIMTHKLKTETFSQKIEHSSGVSFWPLTPLFSFVTLNGFKKTNPIAEYRLSAYTQKCVDKLNKTLN